jgi:hypothetical protein
MSGPPKAPAPATQCGASATRARFVSSVHPNVHIC